MDRPQPATRGLAWTRRQGSERWLRQSSGVFGLKWVLNVEGMVGGGVDQGVEQMFLEETARLPLSFLPLQHFPR